MHELSHTSIDVAFWCTFCTFRSKPADLTGLDLMVWSAWGSLNFRPTPSRAEGLLSCTDLHSSQIQAVKKSQVCRTANGLLKYKWHIAMMLKATQASSYIAKQMSGQEVWHAAHVCASSSFSNASTCATSSVNVLWIVWNCFDIQIYDVDLYGLCVCWLVLKIYGKRCKQQSSHHVSSCVPRRPWKKQETGNQAGPILLVMMILVKPNWKVRCAKPTCRNHRFKTKCLCTRSINQRLRQQHNTTQQDILTNWI